WCATESCTFRARCSMSATAARSAWPQNVFPGSRPSKITSCTSTLCPGWSCLHSKKSTYRREKPPDARVALRCCDPICVAVAKMEENGRMRHVARGSRDGASEGVRRKDLRQADFRRDDLGAPTMRGASILLAGCVAVPLSAALVPAALGP